MKVKIKKQFSRVIFILLTVFAMTGCMANYDKSYTIIFNPNGGVGTMEDLFVEKETTGYLPKCLYTKEGYETVTWSTDSEGKKQFSSFNGSVSSGGLSNHEIIKGKETIELFPAWIPVGFRFNLFGIIGFFTYKLEYEGNSSKVLLPLYYETHSTSPSDNLFEDHIEIEEIILPEFRSLSTSIFSGCTALNKINLPDSLEMISSYAFKNCFSLTNLEIPASVMRIYYGAFSGWTEDQTITIKGKKDKMTLEEGWLDGCNANIIWST